MHQGKGGAGETSKFILCQALFFLSSFFLFTLSPWHKGGLLFGSGRRVDGDDRMGLTAAEKMQNTVLLHGFPACFRCPHSDNVHTKWITALPPSPNRNKLCVWIIGRAWPGPWWSRPLGPGVLEMNGGFHRGHQIFGTKHGRSL